MVKHTFQKSSVIETPADKLFEWHQTDDALEKLIPPGEPVSVQSRTGGIKDGDTVTLRLSFLGPLGMDWVAEHQNYVEGERFEDVQVRGPFAHWVHTHVVEDLGQQRSRLLDEVEYALPFGRLGDWLGGWLVRRKLESMFRYRHRITKDELEG